MGLQAEIPDTGCCGLAGPFGYEKDHYELSQQIGESVLLPAVRNAPHDALIITNGFSCRHQITHATGRPAMHPAEVLNIALDQERRAIPKPKRSKARVAISIAAAGLAVIAVGLAYNGRLRLSG